MKKLSILSLSLVCITTLPAQAHKNQSDFYVCNAYRYTETYNRGGYADDGSYRQGYVSTTKCRIPCGIEYTNISNSPKKEKKECPKEKRMAAGSLIGGMTGYIVGGGKKSKRTLLNTAIGTGVGAVLGRISC